MPYATRERRSRYMRERYQLKKEELKDYQRSNRNLFNKVRLLDLKGINECEGCGEDHPAVLQFHHRDPSTKTKSVMQMVGSNASWKILKKEVDKCDVLCANCHKLEHNNWTEEQINKAHRMVANGEVAINRREYKLLVSDKEKIELLYESGKSIQEIADIFKANRSTVHSYMVKNNIPRRNPSETRAMRKVSEYYFKDDIEVVIDDKEDT